MVVAVTSTTIFAAAAAILVVAIVAQFALPRDRRKRSHMRR